MILRYRNTIDDLSAFSRFTAARSPTYRRTLRSNALVFVATIVLVSLFLGPAEGRWDKHLFVGIGCVFFLLLYPRAAERQLAKTCHRMASEETSAAVLCEHTLEITPESLVARTPLSEARMAWALIPRVAETPTHVFVFTQTYAGHVIPRHAVLEGDLRAFLAALRDRLPAPQGAAPATWNSP